MAPPPNSPWAALDGDFGLELVGYMSKIAEIPGDRYPFRYYTHDPWWLNSPWLDRYGREPHDIYLPMSVARVTGTGETAPPTDILFLTIDNSYGEMPVEVPNEVIPHSAGRADARPAGPRRGCIPSTSTTTTFGDAPRVDEVLFGDWFMRGRSIWFPVNTATTTANLPAPAAAGRVPSRCCVVRTPPQERERPPPRGRGRRKRPSVRLAGACVAMCCSPR